MPYSNTVTLNFVASDFTSNKPSFATTGNYATNLKFANRTSALQLSNTNHGYVVFEVSYTGTLDYVSICFTDPNNGDVSVSSEQNGLYRLSNNNLKFENIVKNETTSGTKTYYVVVNPNQNNRTRVLNVSVALAKKDTAPSSASITLSYDCTTNIYSYETGLHVYSAYDAQDSVARLRTKLYSFVDINNWTTDTRVYASPELNNPALPYYYGYGSNVYKVGGEFERSFGTQKETSIKKKLFGKPKVSERTIGPQSFYNASTTSSDACTIPFMEGVGRIRQIFANSTLSQPQQYRYYMGYNATNIRQSNDSVFSVYSFARKSHDPITGAIHALSKTLPGVVKGYNKDWVFNEWAAAATVLGVALAAPIGVGTYATLAEAASVLLDKWIGPFVPKLFTIGTQLATILSVVGWIAFGALVLFALYKLFFSSKTTIYREDCKQFLYHYTNKPYIFTSQPGNDTILYRDQNLTIVNNGYHCDGVYYYTQTGGKIVNKELSYTNALLSDNPPKFEFKYSIRPDDETLVTNFNKLVILSYVSGKPLPHCGTGTIYYNDTTLTQTVSRSCCALEGSSSTTFTVPAGSIFSCTSQLDANNKATEKLNAMVAYGQSSSNNYCSAPSDGIIGTLDTQFTHDLKIEDNKTTTTVYYDARNGAVAVGTVLYYDNYGCQKVLNGYYGVTGSTPYCTFYKTTNGAVDGIFVMQNSNSTTTNTGQPIIQTTKDYTSNWFLNGTNRIQLDSYTNQIENTRTFDPNSLYSNNKLFKGYIKTQQTLEDFQVTSYNGTTYNEAETGWYRPLIDWIEQDSFYYYNAQTITLDLVEYCPTSNTAQRGVYVVGKSNGVETPTVNAVGVNVDVYTGATPTFYKRYTATTSQSNSRTFISYGPGFTSTTPVSQITLAGITTPNPQNKITYNIGSTTLCTSNCNITLTTTTTNATNQQGTNGTVSLSLTNAATPYNVLLGTVNNGTFTTISGYTGSANPVTFTSGMSTGVTYTLKVTDANSCTKETTFSIGQTIFTFDADYIMLTYQFTNGTDLDTRTRMVTPNIGQTSQLTYLGWGRQQKWPSSSTTPILTWGGDNQGTGFESVLININNFKTQYPSQTSFVMDLRGFWFGSVGSNPVNVAATLWKGGNPVKSGYVWTNTTATSTYSISSVSKQVTLKTTNSGTSGERIATLSYNLQTGQGLFNNNDTTTPSV